MPEETITPPAAGATPEPGAPVTGTTQTTTTSQGATPSKSPTVEDLLKELADLKHAHNNATEERDRHRKKLSSYEKKEQEAEAQRKAAEEAQLSEIERTKKQHAELQAQHNAYVQATQERMVRYELTKQANALGIIDPDAAAILLDRSELEYDDDGVPTNAKALLEKLLKNKPYLAPAKQQEPEPSKNNGVPPQQQQRNPTLPAFNNPGRKQIDPSQAAQGRTLGLSEAYQLAAQQRQQQNR